MLLFVKEEVLRGYACCMRRCMGNWREGKMVWIDWHLILLWSSTNQHFYSLPIASLTGPSPLNSLCHSFLPLFTNFFLSFTHLSWLLIYHCRLRTAPCSILVPNSTSPPCSTPHHVLQRISFAAAVAVNDLDLPLPLPTSPAPPFLSSPYTATSPCDYAASAPERRRLGNLWDYHYFSHLTRLPWWTCALRDEPSHRTLP